MADFSLKKGDRLPSIQATLTDATGIKDLTAASGVSFAMKLQVTPFTVVTGTGVIVDAPGGIVRYDWGASDTTTAGKYNGEWVVTIGGKQQTFPNDGFFVIEILADAS